MWPILIRNIVSIVWNFFPKQIQFCPGQKSFCCGCKANLERPFIISCFEILILLYFSVIDSETVVWNQKKENLINGPAFPVGFKEYLLQQSCSVALNRTHLMLIVGFKAGYTPEFRVIIIDFKNQIWHRANSINEEYIDLCAGLAVEFNKNGKR